ncbi:AbrB/MazE/SpoVT family DNA-binding domain-containing protein [Candidatus Woesearchaeota archaeon]|nr:AbrB/MazE/SpoVT family DNA-binding domain-containing protein [Candidatus Woesearchaeota archaeon]
MATATVVARKWGNSIGVIIPREIVEKEGIKADKRVQIEVKQAKTVLEELFGALPFKKSTEQLLRESRELESKYW